MKCENYVKFNFQYPVKTNLTETQSRPLFMHDLRFAFELQQQHCDKD